MHDVVIIVHVSGPEATDVKFTQGVVRAPVAAGTVLGQLEVLPPEWTGDIKISGDAANIIGANDKLELVAIAEIAAAGDYSITVTTLE